MVKKTIMHQSCLPHFQNVPLGDKRCVIFAQNQTIFTGSPKA